MQVVQKKKIIPKYLKINPETGEWEPPELFLLTRLFDINNKSLA
jgi:hypothetical protein